jgi:hypothetical protein
MEQQPEVLRRDAIEDTDVPVLVLVERDVLPLAALAPSAGSISSPMSAVLLPLAALVPSDALVAREALKETIQS